MPGDGAGLACADGTVDAGGLSVTQAIRPEARAHAPSGSSPERRFGGGWQRRAPGEGRKAH